MIIRNTNSARASAHSRGTGEGVHLRPPSPDNHNCVGRHRPIASKLSDELREYLANQPRLVLIGVSGTARTFEFIDFRPFHTGSK